MMLGSELRDRCAADGYALIIICIYCTNHTSDVQPALHNLLLEAIDWSMIPGAMTRKLKD